MADIVNPTAIPPCLRERSAFMSPRPVTMTIHHKLGHDEKFEHLKPTPLYLPAYSAPALPFRWVSRKTAEELNEKIGTGYDKDREPMEGWMSTGSWVLDPENQRHQLESFWSAVRPSESLCFFYAKEIPGVAEGKRIVVGVGRVSEIHPARKFEKGDPNGYEAWVWERALGHTIRPGFRDGFLFPLQELVAKAEIDPSFELEDFVATAPEEYRSEFSYVTEHVSTDVALQTLDSCRNVLERLADTLEGPWAQAIEWIDNRVSELSKLRGAFPGFGSALSAFDFSRSMLLAEDIRQKSEPHGDLWRTMDAAVLNPNILSPESRTLLTSTLRAKWALLSKPAKADRKALLQLLSRFALSAEQAKLIYDDTERAKANIESDDGEYLSNPYLIYHHLRRARSVVDVFEEEGEEKRDVRVVPPISFQTADRAIFPNTENKDHPLPARSAMESEDDARRLCAAVIRALSRAEDEGHSVLPASLVVERVRAMKLSPPLSIDADTIEALESEIEDFVVRAEMGGELGWQSLQRAGVRLAIQNLLRRNLVNSPALEPTDWLERLEVGAKLGAPIDERDFAARKEKAAALDTIANSRFSVLVGPAGTGKTTLLSALCSHTGIRERGILLLAPTGKARVRLTSKVRGIRAFTVAGFLAKSGRYDSATAEYRMSEDGEKTTEYRTVIVDESSMLTEDQLAALTDAFAGLDRFILVGDPSQLPPIGVGRPFVDLVKALEPHSNPGAHRVARGYAELTQRMRQLSDGEDLQFAELFSGRPGRAGDDEIAFQLQHTPSRERIRAVSWNDQAEFEKTLAEILLSEFSVSNLEELPGTLGAVRDKKGRWTFPEGCEDKVEDWQVLSPRRWEPCGTEDANRFLQQAMRGQMKGYANGMQDMKFRVPKPLGDHQVVYGDKVINLKNKPNPYISPRGGLAHVANGEIGFVVGKILYASDGKKPWFPKEAQVRFGSQPGYRYTFLASDFGNDGGAAMELAYSITIHKAQGSEFKKTIVVLPKKAATMGREIIYTALTRHRDKLILMHEGSLSEFLSAASPSNSETAKRFTCINSNHAIETRRPQILNAAKKGSERPRHLERYLVHLTRSGELVSSKSEVIIAGELDRLRKVGLSYAYERRLHSSKGNDYRLPDFTITASNSREYYWEHCGLLSDKSYAEKWEKKKAWYASEGVTRWHPSTNPEGQLIVTEDGLGGEADASVVKDIVDWMKLNLT